MGTLVRIVQGVWEITPTGEWRFDEQPSEENETVLINPNDPFDGLVEMIRIMLGLGILTPVALTYQLPDWMLLPEGARTPPVTLTNERDVETMLSVRDFMTEPVMYVTSGPELVAKYQFLRRTPFKIGERSFLEEGFTEEQHHQAIRDLVGERPVVCSEPLLELMFNEPQLLSVYRMALGIELVYAPSAEERSQLPRLTVDDVMTIQEGLPIDNDNHNNNDDIEQVVPSEPMDVEQLQQAFPNFRAPNNGPNGIPHVVEPLQQIPPYHAIWEDDSDEEQAYWDGVMEAEQNHEVNVSAAPRPTNGALRLPIVPNLRVTAPPSPIPIIVVDADEGSYSGSSNGLNENGSNVVLHDAGADSLPLENGSANPLS
ncbi:hypothetical protein Bca52824_010843 [Brassica carinata]|uniref:Uncharacterized protein n=1 Tax=Brassica carinata TaxID=52824 RepID=A0A8X7WF65_BRACI|nr:hypothetical protein Bca52824_010843 [Brassica carinata]